MSRDLSNKKAEKNFEVSKTYWDEAHVEWLNGPSKAYWTSNPLLDAYVNLQIAGGFERNTLTWLKEDIFKDLAPLPRIASIACGSGTAGRQALGCGLTNEVDGYDISEGSLDSARKEAADAGLSDRLHYYRHDFNNTRIPNEGKTYPLVIIFGGLHHAKKLEFVLENVESVLSPGGVIFFNEYVGPNRFQYDPRHLEILNNIILSLPDDFLLTDKYVLEDANLIAENDPSEAVRSSEILDRVKEKFHIIDCCNYGGAILYPMWASILRREKLIFRHQVMRFPILQALMVLEENLTSLKILPSLFSQCVICRKQDAQKLGFFSGRFKKDMRISKPSQVLLESDLSWLSWPLPSPTNTIMKGDKRKSKGIKEIIKFLLRKTHLYEPVRLMVRGR